MARSVRKQFAGAKYHVTNRGNGRQRLFYGEDDYARFVDQLTTTVERDRVDLYAYCLMPNHIHLFVGTPYGNLARFMGRLTTAYAMYFRYKHYRPGHCFQGRYKSPLVDGDEYIARLTRYVHLNPVKTRTARTMPVAERWRYLTAYRWSSLAGYLDEAGREPMINYRWLQLFDGRGSRVARRRYGAYARSMVDADDEVLLEAIKASSYAIGDESFRKETERWVRGRAHNSNTPADLDIPGEDVVPLAAIASAVCDDFCVTVGDLHCPRKRIGPARRVFIELACSLGGMSQREVCRYLGGVTEHAISKQRHKLRDELSTNPRLMERVKRTTQVLKSKL